MLLAVIINGGSNLSKELNKISLLKILWNITLFSISRTVVIHPVSFIIFSYYGEIRYLKGFSVLIFPFYYIDLSNNISYNIDKIILFFLNIRQVFYLPLFP